ncbi:hypothetical protein [Bacillus cereus]|uniref:Uncharacterized protein n=1 Tax=Bacillus cereus HuA3-9 TaxID=1053205 RepID=R8CI52_BACCE|nr:hypothetical protein [Bacillus cereus]EOO11294.1 hypothetical protein IGA_05557 [Bacillus cereus HuA3-9]
MRHFTIIKKFPHYDIEKDGEPTSTTLYDEDDVMILTGDDYHDKIDEMIEGFFHALDYICGTGTYKVKTMNINEAE